MSDNCDVVVILPIYGQFGAILKPDSGRIVCKTYIFINSNFLSYKNWKQNNKISQKHSSHTIALRYYFCPKMVIFCKKMLTSAKLRRSWYQKVYFLNFKFLA